MPATYSEIARRVGIGIAGSGFLLGWRVWGRCFGVVDTVCLFLEPGI